MATETISQNRYAGTDLLSAVSIIQKLVGDHKRHRVLGIEYEPTCKACIYYAYQVAQQSDKPAEVSDAMQFLADLFPTMGIKSPELKTIVAEIDNLLTAPSRQGAKSEGSI